MVVGEILQVEAEVAVWSQLLSLLFVRQSDFARCPPKQRHIHRPRKNSELGNGHGFVLLRASLRPGHVCGLGPGGRRLRLDENYGIRLRPSDAALGLFDAFQSLPSELLQLQLERVLPCRRRILHLVGVAV